MTSANLSLDNNMQGTENGARSAAPAGENRKAGGFFAEQRAITGRRLPLAALSILMYFLYDVIGTALAIQRERAVTNMSPDLLTATWPERGARIVSNWMGFRGIVWIITIVGAVLLAIQGFAYLYRSQTVDFYESRPEKRGARFRNIVLNSIFIYMIPSLAGVLIAFGLAVGNGCAAGWVLAEMLVAWVYQTAMFLAVYAMSALASLLAGTVVTAVLMNAFFFGIEALLRLTIYFHREAYYATFDSEGRYRMISRFLSLPPFHYLRGLLAANIWNGPDSAYNWTRAARGVVSALPGALINLAIFAVFLAVAYAVYRARKAEFAGKAVTYRGVALFIKVSAAILFSLCAGLFVYWIFDHRSGAELSSVVLTVVVVVFVGCAALEAVFALNVRQVFHRFWQAPLIAVCALIVLFVYRTDAFGYDRWLPAEDKVESAWLLRQTGGSFYDENGEYMSKRTYVESRMFLTDIDDLRTLAGIAQEQFVRVRDPQAVEDFSSEEYRGWYATIGWRMKNGRVVTRNILIPENIDPGLMDRIVGADAWAEGNYPYLNDPEEIRRLAALRSPDGVLGLTVSTEHGAQSGRGDLIEGFLAAYRQDLSEHYDFTLTSYQRPVGCATIHVKNNRYAYFGLDYPLFENFDRTIAFLSENDVWPGGFLTPDEIDEVRVQFNGSIYDENGEWIDNYSSAETYTDRAQIRELMEASLPTNYESVWERSGIYENSRFDLGGSWEVEAFYAGGGWMENSTRSALGYAPDAVSGRGEKEVTALIYPRGFLKDRVPAFVQKLAAP